MEEEGEEEEGEEDGRRRGRRKGRGEGGRGIVGTGGDKGKKVIRTRYW